MDNNLQQAVPGWYLYITESQNEQVDFQHLKIMFLIIFLKMNLESVSKPRVFFIDAENTCREVCCLPMLWVQRGKCAVSVMSATLTSPTRNYVRQDVIRSAFPIAELHSMCAAKGRFLEQMTSDSPWRGQRVSNTSATCGLQQSPNS